MQNRGRFLLGNWKMSLTPKASQNLAVKLRELFEAHPLPMANIAVFPSFIALMSVNQILTGSVVNVGAQNMFWEHSGAFTGESDAASIQETGSHYVLIGHSERRHILNEPEEWMPRKLKAATRAGLRAVLCVGETQAERQAGQTEAVLRKQLAALSVLDAAEYERVVIAYEPVWAIGTGIVADEAQIAQAHGQIRHFIRQFSSSASANGQSENEMAIVYGGSVKVDYARAILQVEGVDGLLVGGASLDAQGFYHIGRAFVDESS